MTHPTVVLYDIKKAVIFSQRTETRHILKQRCLLKDELKTHGQALI